MESNKAYLVGIHPYYFRCGEPAEIIGVVIATPKDSEPRPCFHIRFEDGEEDYIPLSDFNCHKIISEKEVLEGKIPVISL